MGLNQFVDEDKLTSEELDNILAGSKSVWKKTVQDENAPTNFKNGDLEHIQTGFLSQEEIEKEKRYLENLYQTLDEQKKSCEQGRTR